MFPESFAEHWIDDLTKSGDWVLDPFCGRGTAPFQALLMGRRTVGADINPAAYCITRAKTMAPQPATVRHRLTRLEKSFDALEWDSERRRLPTFFRGAYSPATLRQILFLRGSLKWRDSDTDCLIAALVLGALHGETKSPYYFSNQMPRTISTKPAYSLRFWAQRELHPPKRDVFSILRDRLAFRYESEPPRGNATILNTDMRELPRLMTHRPPIKCVITSPPYMNVTSFEEDQWLRLWFLGGPSFPRRGVISPDDRHASHDGYWRLIADMWRTLGQLVEPKAHVVIRIGAKNTLPENVTRMLTGAALAGKRRVRLVGSEVSEIRGRQTDAFRPGSTGCAREMDCHFVMA